MGLLSKVVVVSVMAFVSVPALAQSVDFGNDSSEYSNDGECDDRRFIGTGMATDLDEDDNFGDAADCKKLYDAGMIKLVSASAGQAATNCSEIKFGDDTGSYAKDGECDDPRFDGPDSAGIVLRSDLLSDASDCLKACKAGRIWVRTAKP